MQTKTILPPLHGTSVERAPGTAHLHLHLHLGLDAVIEISVCALSSPPLRSNASSSRRVVVSSTDTALAPPWLALF